MAKKFTVATYDNQHLRNLYQRATNLSGILGDAAKQAVKIGEATEFCDSKGEFRFDKFPAVKERVDELFRALHERILLNITEGNREGWLLSATKNDALVNSYVGSIEKYGEQAKKWLQPNLEALEAFQNRKEKGMTLSDRVWKLTDQYKSELELALEMGLGDGKSAAALSRDVRQYLNEPHKLFRRVRNEKGQLRLSKAAAAYHPGQGVYRSSYKNALRLTATENNMAYRTADHERWQQLDFVIGYEIRLSGNHPCEDICDRLAGVYPKSFKFTGWHPFCRCTAIPKLADKEDFIARQRAKLKGEEVPTGYGNEVTEMPESFNEWVEENRERIENAKTEPYFIRDNREVMEAVFSSSNTSQPYPHWKMLSSEVTENGFGKFKTNGFTAEDFNNSPMGGINLPLLDKGVSSIFEESGATISSRELRLSEDGTMVTWKLAKGKGEMTRLFKKEADGSITVEHSYFQLAKQYQGKGLSKALFRELYSHYRGIGVAKLEVHANIDRGGYVWAKYGFFANNATEAQRSLDEARMAGHKSLKAAEKLIEEFYEKYPSAMPFPMHRIAALPDGKGLLLNADWCGFIDLRNAEQRSIFESYLDL